MTDFDEMGQYAFGNLPGWEDYAAKSESGDIIITGENFGAGSSRQQAVDCFKALKNNAILARSFGAIYERNAINSAMPILIAKDITSKIEQGDELKVDYTTGKIINKTKNKEIIVKPFSTSQLEIYKRGGLLKK